MDFGSSLIVSLRLSLAPYWDPHHCRHPIGYNKVHGLLRCHQLRCLGVKVLLFWRIWTKTQQIIINPYSLRKGNPWRFKIESRAMSDFYEPSSCHWLYCNIFLCSIYDGIISFDFYIAKGTGSLAVAFRMTSDHNTWDSDEVVGWSHMRVSDRRYVYEVRQERGIKRLLKVVDGKPVELAVKSDGGNCIRTRGRSILRYNIFRLSKQRLARCSDWTQNGPNQGGSWLLPLFPL